MKKKISKSLFGIIMLAVLVIISAVSIFASEVYPADDDELIKKGEAVLNVKYKSESPVMDGKVELDEYYEIPYEEVKSYYNFAIGNKLGDYTPDEKYALLLDYVKQEMKVYACWDGKNFCFALVANAPSYEYTCPSDKADSVNLFRYWCTQFGFAAPDAEGMDRIELGVGAASDVPGECFCYDAWGTRTFNSFEKGVNYCANYDKALQQVTYEIKVNVKEVTGTPAAEGGQMRFLYLLSQSGQYVQSAGDFIQIQCGLGCAADKRADWFLMVNLQGLPEDETLPEDNEDFTSEVEQEGFWSKTDFRKESNAALISEKQDVVVERLTDDNDEAFLRITATGSTPFFGGPKFPIGVNGSGCRFMAIRYRTTSPNSKWVGFSFRSPSCPDDSDEYMYSNDNELYNDGQWHTTVVDMTVMAEWESFITNMRIWPFVETQADITGNSIDIMWLKFYETEPYFDDTEGTIVSGNETTAVEEITTVAETMPEITTTVAENTTTETAQNVTTTAVEESTTASEKKSGCSGFAAIPALLVLAVVATPAIRKKHK